MNTYIITLKNNKQHLVKGTAAVFNQTRLVVMDGEKPVAEYLREEVQGWQDQNSVPDEKF